MCLLFLRGVPLFGGWLTRHASSASSCAGCGLSGLRSSGRRPRGLGRRPAPLHRGTRAGVPFFVLPLDPRVGRRFGFVCYICFLFSSIVFFVLLFVLFLFFPFLGAVGTVFAFTLDEGVCVCACVRVCVTPLPEVAAWPQTKRSWSRATQLSVARKIESMGIWNPKEEPKLEGSQF